MGRKDDAERRGRRASLQPDEKGTAAAFVNILFGLVVSQAVIEIVLALRTGYVAEDIDAIHATRLSHLLLAMLVTSLSWIGYHQGTSRPFLIRYWNVPLTTFVLDVSLVATYYALIVVAEHPGGDHQSAIPADARPEAVLLVVVFLLYLAWDGAGHRLSETPGYAAGPGVAGQRLPRRLVTAVALGGVALAAAVVAAKRPETPGGIVVADGVLAVIAVAYRVAKQWFPGQGDTSPPPPTPVTVPGPVTVQGPVTVEGPVTMPEQKATPDAQEPLDPKDAP